MLASSAGDDATAALTMILRYHRKPVTFDEVQQAIYPPRAPATDQRGRMPAGPPALAGS